MYSILFNNLPCFFLKIIILNLYYYNKFNNIYFEERERERERAKMVFIFWLPNHKISPLAYYEVDNNYGQQHLAMGQKQ